MTRPQAYQAAMNEWRAEQKRFFVVRDAYRARRVGDAAFLAAQQKVEVKFNVTLEVLDNYPL